MKIAEIKRQAEPILKAHGVARASVFGSTARGDASEASDVDLLVRFHQPKGLIAYSRLVEDLSSTLGRDVDVVTEDGLNPHLRSYVLKDTQVIYEN